MAHDDPKAEHLPDLSPQPPPQASTSSLVPAHETSALTAHDLASPIQDVPFQHEPSRTNAGTRPGASKQPVAKINKSDWNEQELQQAADRIVLARFGPPGLIIDDRMNVLQSRGQTSAFLDITPGAVSWNLLRVLKDSLANGVLTAVQEAIRDNLPASTRVVLVDERKGEQYIAVDVLPIAADSTRPRTFLILFQTLAIGLERPLPDQVPQSHLNGDQEQIWAHKGIQWQPDGFQNTKGTLGITSEELQSANKELQTVNDELQQRNNVLTQTGNDLTNLLNSVNIPLLMLDRELRIRQFTPPMQRLLSVRQSDMGRSINEIRPQLDINDLEPILNEVLESLGTCEMEVQDKQGRWHLLRVHPYCTSENKIEGLVVLLLDIDLLRRSRQQLVDARDFASSVVESVPVPIVVLNEDCAVRTANTAFRELAQMSPADLVGRSMPDLADLLWGVKGIREQLENLLRGPVGSLLEFEHESTTAERRTLLIKAQALSTGDGRVLLLMMEDISLRREVERLSTQEKRTLESEIAITARKLDRTQEELRGLNKHLFAVQEEERQRVARELHDDISQRLSLVEMDLQQILSHDPKGIPEGMLKLQAVREQLSTLNTDVRTMSHRLHPAILEDLGLPVALKALVTEFGAREGMPANYSGHNLPDTLPMEASIALYRITQEALRNVAKHAGKTHVKVVLSASDRVVELKVMDFGIGFDHDGDPPTPGLGMISMHERARLAGGAIDVQSALGQGTTITVTIPLEVHA